jgi:type IV/VI secretion system ImpK/VasF family protein
MEYLDYRTELFRLAAPLFLYLVSFRRKVLKGYQPEEGEVQRDLERIVTEMDLRSRQDPRLDALYQKAKYPLVILADEIVLNSDWEHAGAWEQNLLEEKHFSTNIGGDKVFLIAEELMHDEVELATILYTAVSLGVKGRYHRRPEKLQEVKSKLYRSLGEYLGDVQNVITPEAYNFTPSPAKRLDMGVALTHIGIGVGVLVVFYVIANLLMWGSVVSTLQTLTAAWM